MNSSIDARELRLAKRREQWALNRDENCRKMREYRAASIEKFRALRREDYARRRDAILKKQRAQRAANPDGARARDRARYRVNGDKKRQSAREWHARNREKSRKKSRAYHAASRARLGLPAPTRPEPSHCECCGGKGKRALALDHCHETGAFRGWLCDGCNTSIGRLGDSIEGVQRALDYLRRASMKTGAQ